jgi:hypothetical protein
VGRALRRPIFWANPLKLVPFTPGVKNEDQTFGHLGRPPVKGEGPRKTIDDTLEFASIAEH